MQNARRESGLEVTDRIELRLAGDAELLDAARAHEAYVAGETLATSVAYDGEPAQTPPSSDAKRSGRRAVASIEGRELRIDHERSV